MKNINKNKLEVNFYLAPSKISGVGLFTRVDIKRGEILDKKITNDAKFIKKSDDLDLMNKLCVKVKNGWWCPADFSRPYFWWYINHSKKPNVKCDKNNKFTSIKNINAGEEITIDYKNLAEGADNSDLEFTNKKAPENFYQ
jgi:hypothetical protein